MIVRKYNIEDLPLFNITVDTSRQNEQTTLFSFITIIFYSSNNSSRYDLQFLTKSCPLPIHLNELGRVVRQVLATPQECKQLPRESEVVGGS